MLFKNKLFCYNFKNYKQCKNLKNKKILMKNYFFVLFCLLSLGICGHIYVSDINLHYQNKVQ